MPPHKTDNSHLEAKVALRLEALRQLGRDSVHVVDAFAGTGLVWAEVRARTDVDVQTLSIDRKPYAGASVISADNRKVLGGLDYRGFDLVDLDAYGVPHEQLRLVAKAAPALPVLVTCILGNMSIPPGRVLDAAGIPEAWRRNAPQVLFARWKLEFWSAYAASLGYTHTLRYVFRDPNLVKVYELLTRTPTAQEAS